MRKYIACYWVDHADKEGWHIFRKFQRTEDVCLVSVLSQHWPQDENNPRSFCVRGLKLQKPELETLPSVNFYVSM